MADEKATLTFSPEVPKSQAKSERTALLEAVEGFWTADRLRSAEPIPLPQPLRSTLSEAAKGLGYSKMLVEKAQRPTRRQASVLLANVQTAAEPTWSEGKPATAKVTTRAEFPYAAVGKIFSSFGSKDYVSSGWVIGESAVFTAGHCVYDEDAGWADKLLFVPQYADGSMPVGSWTSLRIASVKGWTNKPKDWRYDLAIFKTDRPLATLTGALGWVADEEAAASTYASVGYPAGGSKHDGKHMWRSVGQNIKDDPDYLCMYNDMTPGCSGGPWATWENGQIVVRGLNSFRYSETDRMYSSDFSEAFTNLYDWAT